MTTVVVIDTKTVKGLWMHSAARRLARRQSRHTTGGTREQAKALSAVKFERREADERA